jgi:hypothetical protein
MANERRQQDQRGDAAHEQELPHRIGRKQPLAERIIDREQSDAGQHQPDPCHGAAGGRRGSW